MKNFFTISVFLLFVAATSFSQLPGFSIATDMNVQRSFKKDQRFWAIGQTIQAQFHFDKTNGIYAWFSHFSNGNFTNNLIATAKSPLTIPSSFNYKNKVQMRLKQFSIGWRKYLFGTFDSEKRQLSLYGNGGFGLLLGSVTNIHSVSIDTANYNAPVLNGKANFKRITIDLGLGAEIPLTGDFYIYGETKIWLPTPGYPSQHLLVNDRAPLTVMVSGGLRLLF